MPKKQKSVENPSKREVKIGVKTSASIHKPEDDQHCSSAYCDKAIIFKPQELRQKLTIASNILLECKKEMKTGLLGRDRKNDVSGLKKLNNYTNLPIHELNILSHSMRTRDRTFAKAMKDTREITGLTLRLMADDIRWVFYDFIVVKTNFPSKTDFLKQLKIATSKYTNENIPIQRLVKNKLLKYHYFPELNTYLLTEHPERVYERTVYLNTIKELRSQGRNFVYVEVRRMIPRGTSSRFITGLAAFPITGQFEKFFTKDTAELIAKKWMQQKILPLIEQGTVVVLAQPDKCNEPPSKKCDIQLWLDDHKIPYDADSHTAELYQLYEIFRRKMRQEGLYDHVFQKADLTVVNCPSDWRKLNFYQSIWADVEVMDNFITGKQEILKQKILSCIDLITDLTKLEKNLEEEECKMLEEDMKMEHIVENTLEMVKNGEISTSDFPKELCGDKTNYFEAHISDFIVD